MSNTAMALGCIALGVGALALYADHMRTGNDEMFYRGGRNSVALCLPGSGAMMLFGGMLGLVQEHAPDSFWAGLLTVLSLLGGLCFAIGLLPIPLPDPMYPHWHAERRERRRIAEGRSRSQWSGWETIDRDRR